MYTALSVESASPSPCGNYLLFQDIPKTSLKEFGRYFEQDDDLHTCSLLTRLSQSLTYKICFGDLSYAHTKQEILFVSEHWCAIIIKQQKKPSRKQETALTRREYGSCDLLCNSANNEPRANWKNFAGK